MAEHELFDPRNDRIARNIRNDLARIFVKNLDRQLNLAPVRELASRLLTTTNEKDLHREYIHDRLQRFEEAKKMIVDREIDDDLQRALVLWDHELFFETHEVLEKLWINAVGAEKMILQALIRAAGYFIHLRSGNMIGAEKMAARACETFNEYRRSLPPIQGLDLLIECLRLRKTVPPKLL